MRYEVDSTTGCWIWTGPKTPYGYGIAKGMTAHRAIYQLLIETIPPGCHVHHRCENPSCINPEHLDLLSVREHIHTHHPLREACIHGHPYDARNTYIRKDGRGRQCRTCKATRERERQRRLRAPKLAQTLSPEN